MLILAQKVLGFDTNLFGALSSDGRFPATRFPATRLDPYPLTSTRKVVRPLELLKDGLFESATKRD